ncbi:baseplate J/gp47 family protein [Aliifodinibius salicampi]|uniref:Baseplate J/gp47 family protein n=1 Tax=Fodinibius salicampi TaxID=1920655 RepID=A0ABT3PZ04_9BACT|nr:baseplate J/gp47 family protein [Fodinibius salicampi]MCW9713093.1 baseplate J/gp47 family protein [Fodinibius salicampi]
MSDSCQHSNPLIHQGTSQSGRFLDALDPEKVKLHDLDADDWLDFAYEYARLVNFYAEDNAEEPRGDWQDFFETEGDIESLLERYGDGEVEPHLALFISFLKLLAYPQESINELPQRHLDFYYKDVLKLKKQPYTPDKVHVLFELAQNAQQELVDSGVLLKAGKDSEGNPLNYSTTTPLVVNSAQVASLKSVYVDEGILRHAPVTDSADGQGKEFKEENSWPAFGREEWPEEDLMWPEAELSFYVASHLLDLQEGNRIITLAIELANPSLLEDLSPTNIKAYFTGEKGWLDPVQATFSGGNKTKWQFELNAEEDPVLGYKEAVHEASIGTDQPVVKVTFSDPDYYENLKRAKIKSIELKVEVEGVKTLQLQNELGNLDPTKPFRPFGSSPKIGSKLSVVYPEMYGKPVSRFELSMRWLNLPANFSEHYKHYEDAINSKKQSYSYKIDDQINYNAAVFYNTEWLVGGIPVWEIINGSDGPPDDNMRENFKVEVTSPFETGSDTFELFTDPAQVKVDIAGTGITKKGEIELALTESFYHDLYPELYVNAVMEAQKTTGDMSITIEGTEVEVEGDEGSGSVDLPNEPYTPLLDQLTLSYTAREDISFTEELDEDLSTVLFHRHPFGTKRVIAENKTLLPSYNHGTLFVGLEKMESGSNISLLFQVAEGSENPLYSNFPEGETHIEWAVLSDNDWIDLKDHFTRNETNNFLRSGIVEIAIPEEATSNNTLVNGGLHWLRIHLKKEPDAVCRFTGIHAQAATAVFHNQENTTDHLEAGLPAETIGKMVNPRAKLKSVSQPYESFGGRPTETDNAFYRRVSERLRHKNRAVSIWDYEHVVLEQFPSLYKVKCLNHAYWDGSELDEMSPGNVTLVLIPKLTEENIEHRLEPRVSQDFKDRVEEYVAKHNSLHADTRAANAVYEPVRFQFDIRFDAGLDFSFYEKQAKEDLKRLMAPWVFDPEINIRFGGSFTEYQIVNYLENLEYVDYIEDFKMFHKPVNSDEEIKKSEVKPSNAMAILVPAQNHSINPATACT